MGWKQRRMEKKALEISAALGDLLSRGVTFNPDGSLGFLQIYSASYGRLYKTQSSVRAVVDFLARNISQCKVNVFGPGPQDSSQKLPDHPVQRLLDHPLPGVPRSRFMRQIVADKAIYDVAVVWKIRETFQINDNGTATNRGRVVNLVRLPVPYVQVLEGSLIAPAVFSVQAGPDSVRVPAKDIIWMPGYSPDSNVNGVPPMETLRQILAEEWAAGKDRENFWKRGPALNAVFTQQDGSAGLIDEGAVARFREQWNARYGGVGGTDSHGVPVLPPGLKPEVLAINAQDAEYLATRQLARSECAMAYGIQPQLLGITPSNFASMDMYHQMLYQDTLAPIMVPIQEDLEEQLLREFEAEDSGVFLDFNINAKLQGSFLDQASIGQQAVGGPWMTINEFREKFQGLPPVEDGDEIIIPLNTVRGGGDQANPQDAENQFTGKGMRLVTAEGDEL